MAIISVSCRQIRTKQAEQTLHLRLRIILNFVTIVVAKECAQTRVQLSSVLQAGQFLVYQHRAVHRRSAQRLHRLVVQRHFDHVRVGGVGRATCQSPMLCQHPYHYRHRPILDHVSISVSTGETPESGSI